jgi:hypothetical protein
MQRYAERPPSKPASESNSEDEDELDMHDEDPYDSGMEIERLFDDSDGGDDDAFYDDWEFDEADLLADVDTGDGRLDDATQKGGDDQRVRSSLYAKMNRYRKKLGASDAVDTHWEVRNALTRPHLTAAQADTLLIRKQGSVARVVLGDANKLARVYFRFTQLEVFRMRWIHSMLILSVITYLKLSTLLFQTFYCVTRVAEDGTESLRLEVELSTVCFEGDHLLLTIFTCVTLLPFIIVAPLMIGKRLRANFHDSMPVTRKVLFERVERFGFLVRHLVREFYWFQLLVFLLNFCFAIRIVFVTTTDLAIFSAGLLFLFRLTLAISLRPYERLIKFGYECLVGTTAVSLCVVFLYFLWRADENGTCDLTACSSQTQSYFFSLAVLEGLLITGIAALLLYARFSGGIAAMWTRLTLGRVGDGIGEELDTHDADEHVAAAEPRKIGGTYPGMALPLHEVVVHDSGADADRPSVDKSGEGVLSRNDGDDSERSSATVQATKKTKKAKKAKKPKVKSDADIVDVVNASLAAIEKEAEVTYAHPDDAAMWAELDARENDDFGEDAFGFSSHDSHRSPQSADESLHFDSRGFRDSIRASSFGSLSAFDSVDYDMQKPVSEAEAAAVQEGRVVKATDQDFDFLAGLRLAGKEKSIPTAAVSESDMSSFAASLESVTRLNDTEVGNLVSQLNEFVADFEVTDSSDSSLSAASDDVFSNDSFGLPSPTAKRAQRRDVGDVGGGRRSSRRVVEKRQPKTKKSDRAISLAPLKREPSVVDSGQAGSRSRVETDGLPESAVVSDLVKYLDSVNVGPSAIASVGAAAGGSSLRMPPIGMTASDVAMSTSNVLLSADLVEALNVLEKR